MSRVVIRAEGLGKRYRIGGPPRANSLRDAIAARVRPRRDVAAERTIWALRDVSFEIEDGAVVGIVGRNGAGKTTLLKILSRITPPTEGRAEVRGRVGSLLEVGTGFHWELTGRENVYLSGVILGMTRAEIGRKFDAIVGFAEVERFVDTPIKHYSSGMQVRLAFAVAAHLESDVLLVDEVLAVGDTEFQRKCLGKMGELSRAGRTVLFVSHSLPSLATLCTRGLLLAGGRKVFEGPIGEVLARYTEGVREQAGEAAWPTPGGEPGDERVRLTGVRVIADGRVTGQVAIAKDFHIEILYRNLQPGARRVVSIHLTNAMGVCVLTSGNLPSVSVSPDPWADRPCPVGLFRTTCTIPGELLNDGVHTISVYINASSRATDNVVVVKDVLAFEVCDTGEMRREYFGPWLGAVRPRLAWQTEQVG